MGTGGAESNVAMALARLGHRFAWVIRVGDDPFGRIVTDAVAAGFVPVPDGGRGIRAVVPPGGATPETLPNR